MNVAKTNCNCRPSYITHGLSRLVIIYSIPEAASVIAEVEDGKLRVYLYLGYSDGYNFPRET
jgi:hypothetical protein